MALSRLFKADRHLQPLSENGPASLKAFARRQPGCVSNCPFSVEASLLHGLSPPRSLSSTASLLHGLSSYGLSPPLQAPDRCCDDPAWLCANSLEILNNSDGGYSAPASPDANPLGCDSIRSQWRLRGFYGRPVHWRRLQRPWSFLKNIHELGHGGSL